MVIIGIAINVLLSRVTRHPASMHCPWWDDAFVSSSDCHFYQLTKLQMLLLMTSCQMHRRLILRWSLLITYWRTMLLWIQISAKLVGVRQSCGRSAIQTMAPSLITAICNAEFYAKHPNIYMFVDVLKKIQQTALCTHEQFVTTGTHIKVWTWEEW